MIILRQILDLSVKVRCTAQMIFFDVRVKCLSIGDTDAKEHLKHMARQRCAGANGGDTG